MDDYHIKSLRQQRTIAALLEKAVQVKDLGPLIGALNPRQVVFELRQLGFEGTILTRRFTVRDQDGRLCRPGEYFIPDILKPFVEAALRDYVLRTIKKSSGSVQRSDDSRED